MKPSLGDVSLPNPPLRRLGIGLLAVALLMPFLVLILRASRWQMPPLDEALASTSQRPEMVMLSSGTFMMGSPPDEPGRFDDETLHEVTLGGFRISRTEVTQGQYRQTTGEEPMLGRTDDLGDPCEEAGVGDGLPLVCVTWLEAVRYCNALSRVEGLEPAYEIDGERVRWNRGAGGYRLPTEAEWEYAARAGTRTAWVGTAAEEEVCAHANVADAALECSDSFLALAPVTALPPNAWQLHGMGGNAAEWVWDSFGVYPEGPVEDPVFEERGASGRVFRGGSWRYSPRLARVASRDRVEPSGRSGFLGFRVARSLPSVP